VEKEVTFECLSIVKVKVTVASPQHHPGNMRPYQEALASLKSSYEVLEEELSEVDWGSSWQLPAQFVLHIFQLVRPLW
jgi:hypothetical protein